ncbi:MAG: hypothetical protein WEA11_08145 [Acidimicrobiales bacterium]
MVPSKHRVTTRIRRGTVAMFVTAVSLFTISYTPAFAVTTPASTLTAGWLAAQVGTDGAVNVPGETFSATTQTMYVAQGLAATGQQRAALARAMGYIALHAEEWITNDGSGATVAPSGSDLPERLGSLILLVNTVGGDPRSFGIPAIDLVARVQALYGIATPGFYGFEEPYSAVQDQSLVVMALKAIGASVPVAAVQWIVDQQCLGGTNPASSLGGWMASRTATGGVLNNCTAPNALNYTGADTNSTAFALQALAYFGTSGPLAAGLDFLRSSQTTTGPQASGFPWFAGGDPDPNSTALVLQALIAAGQSPAGGSWSVNGVSPDSVLTSWQLTSPAADAGSLYAAWQPGVPSLLATYQGLWGLTLTAFPFPVLPPIVPEVTPPTFTG